MRLSSFTSKQYAEFYKDVTAKNVTKHIEQLVKLNLIRDSLLPSSDGKPVYKVVDPRIIHMINCDVLEIEWDWYKVDFNKFKMPTFSLKVRICTM